MGMDVVLALLKDLGGRATITEINELARKKGLGKSYVGKVEVRDSLIRLKQRGLVSGNPVTEDFAEEVWAILS